MNAIETIDQNIPIWQLTVGEFTELLQSVTPTIIKQKEAEDNLVYGIDGIADIFNCSKSQAQSIKNSGRIDGAITQIGRKIVVDKAKALELASIKPKRGRRR